MKLVAVTAFKTSSERHTLLLNPVHVLSVQADESAPLERSVITLIAPIPGYGAQFKTLENFKKVRGLFDQAAAT